MVQGSCYGRRLSARSSKAGSSFFVGDCNKNLDPLDDIYYYTQVCVNLSVDFRRFAFVQRC